MRNDNGVYAPHADKPWAEGNGFPPAHEAALREGLLLPPPDGLLKTDAHGVILEVNDPAAELFQCNRAFLLGKPLGLTVDELSRPAVYKFLTRSDLFWEPRMLELRLGRPELKQHDVIAIVEAEGGGSGQPILFRWQLRDVTSLRRIERRCARSGSSWTASSTRCRPSSSSSTRPGACCAPTRTFTRCPAIRPRNCIGDRGMRSWSCRTTACSPTAWSTRRSTKARPKRPSWHCRSTRAAGVRSPGRRGLPEGVAGSVVLLGHDVTEIEKAQAESLRTARLAAIGQVAAGLAHEGRNALQRIQACLSMLALRLGQGTPDVADLVSPRRSPRTIWAICSRTSWDTPSIRA